MHYHASHSALGLSMRRRPRTRLSWGATAAVCLLLCTAAPAAATTVIPAGESFSGGVIGNPVLTGDPVVLSIILNSSPAISPPKMITCTGGLVLGRVPEAPFNSNVLVSNNSLFSGSVAADSQTTLSIGGCEFTGKIPMSESGNHFWSLTWDYPAAAVVGTTPARVALVRIPAGLNLIGQIAEHASCTVTIGPNEAQTILGEWTNPISPRLSTMRFTNQELIASVSSGCTANAVHTVDVSAEYSMIGQSRPIEMNY